MDRELKRYCPPRPRPENENENELEANAAAIAYNENYNILVVPNNGGFGANDLRNNGLNGNRNTLDDIMKAFADDDGEIRAESKAVGKANIKNVNLNLIITL
ncbi:hypothetical protein [Clostridium lundense]|uniref:hypothetical protein n=1 Tax=Clostridium lundense TaxID=319475 RepID=UPI000485EE65|nr:hypothetical protein [Clostridium lundense]